MSEKLPIRFNVIIHGTPAGQQSNATKDDPIEFVGYTDSFHNGDGRLIDFPSSPGTKFIKEILPSGTLAYTFVRTGIHEAHSGRPGSNYGGITLFLPNNIQISNEQEFQQKLKQWFETNILGNFTVQENNGWLKWTDNAQFYLFGGRQDAQIGETLRWLFEYLSTPEKTHKGNLNIKDLNAATQKLQEEIRALEQQKKQIQQTLAEKYAELGNLTKQEK